MTNYNRELDEIQGMLQNLHQKEEELANKVSDDASTTSPEYREYKKFWNEVFDYEIRMQAFEEDLNQMEFDIEQLKNDIKVTTARVMHEEMGN